MKYLYSERIWVVQCGRPRKGAWIEINGVELHRKCTEGRPRKGAWIEILTVYHIVQVHGRSPPQGGVD